MIIIYYKQVNPIINLMEAYKNERRIKEILFRSL
jgi:hypothetical protein